MYVIRGFLKDQLVYYVSLHPQQLFGTTMYVTVCSETLDGATKYDSFEDADIDCRELNNSNFTILPICPSCNKEYDDTPAISRKDNKTEICPTCGTKEALLIFANHITSNGGDK